MGTFTFKWEHPDASDVFVTGDFDKWSKSEKLDKKGAGFEKIVTVPDASEKIYYKFVVDGKWVTDPTAPQENDPSGNLNNFLTPDRISKHTPATAGIMSGVAPGSTAHGLAKDVPYEKSATSDLPGTFPETPATEPAAFSVNPLPATEGAGNPISLAPGEKVPNSSAITSNNVTSTVHDDLSLGKSGETPEQTFSVAPIPATSGAGNPVHLGAGEPLPAQSEVTAHTIDSTVRTDKESYEAADSGISAPLAQRDEDGTGVSDLPPSKGLIPESSLPMGAAAVSGFNASPTIQSAGAQSTTAALAAQVPLEKKADAADVPAVVKESQEEAGVDPEASAVPEEVQGKSEVEKQLLSKVPAAKPTSDDTTAAVKSAGTTVAETGAAVGGAALAVGGAALAYATTAKDKVAEGVSQATTSTPAQTATTAATEAKDKVAVATGLTGSAANTATTDVTPAVVKESIAESGQSAEAAAYAEPVAEKAAMEKELLAEVKASTATGEPAPKIAEAAAASPAAAALSPPVSTPTPDSRDISPTTVPGSHKQPRSDPSVTTGVASISTTEKSTAAPASTSSTSTPTKPATAGSSAAAAGEAKKNKRRSLFGKLKDKLSDKKKE